MLPEQVQQSCLECRHGVNCDAQVERLQTSSRSVAIRKAASHTVQNAVIAADRLTDDQLARVLQRLPNLVATRYLANAGISRTVFQDDDVPSKEGTVRATEVHQHAVVAGNRNHLQFGDHRSAEAVGRCVG